MDKLELFFKSKKGVTCTVFLISLALFGNIYLLFSINDWSRHRFEIMQKIVLCVVLGYAIYVVFKRYKAQNRQTGDDDYPRKEE